MGLFRDITRYSQSRYTNSKDTNADDEGDVNTSPGKITPGTENKSPVADAALDETKSKDQDIWFRFIGDLCQPVVPKTLLSVDVQNYELVPLRAALSLSSVAYSLTIDFLENGSFFELVVQHESEEKNNSLHEDFDCHDTSNSDLKSNDRDDDVSSEECNVKRFQRLYDYFFGNKKGLSGSSRKSKNARLMSTLVRGIGSYLRSLDVGDVLHDLIVDAIVCERGATHRSRQSTMQGANVGLRDEDLSFHSTKDHWVTNMYFTQRIRNSAANSYEQGFTNSDVVNVLWRNEDFAVESSSKYDNGKRTKSDWFSLPLLAMPLMDAVVALVATSSATPRMELEKSSKSADVMDIEGSDGDLQPGDMTSLASEMSSIKWMCIASLVQCSICVEFLLSTESNKMASVASSSRISTETIESVLTTYPALDNLIASSINQFNMQKDSEFGVVRDELFYRVMGVILEKWLSFLQSTLHFLGRCCPEIASLFAANCLAHQQQFNRDGRNLLRVDGGISEKTIGLYLSTLGLKCLMSNHTNTFKCDDENVTYDSAHSVISSAVSRWIQSLLALTSRQETATPPQQYVLSIERLHDLLCKRVSLHSYPCAPREQPQFVTLPNSYTKLHGILTGLCEYDYPALCITCGSVIDASGKGLCTKHNADCPSGVGIYFLLQDCTILLLDGMRGTYYAAPYVDTHGEKHRSFRGKPLYIDEKRCVFPQIAFF